jgi:GH24 family phage-related lysozyme (muramidase)
MTSPQPQAADAVESSIRKTMPSPDGASGDSEQELDALREMLKTEEGYRTDVYLDSLGIPTVGIGHKVLPSDGLKVGDRIDDARAGELFANDGLKALNAAKSQASQAGISDPDFTRRLGSVNFQLGPDWTQRFQPTWAKIVAGDYQGAAENLGKSKWARQTPSRVKSFQDALMALPPKTSRDP